MTHATAKSGGTPPPAEPLVVNTSAPREPGPPAMALRTYRFLRLGVVAVIAMLAAAILREALKADPHCIQGSISAYYFTPVRSVFVGALVALGFTMIVLWGKTAWEDSLFNLAGMLAPVVAFVPTGESNKCLIRTAAGQEVQTDQQKQKVLDASHAAVLNNMFAYLAVLGIALLVLLAIGIVAHAKKHKWRSIVEHKLAFWGSWVAATVLWLVGFVQFNTDPAWLYNDAHTLSAIVMFVFIVGAIVAVGVEKYVANDDLDEPAQHGWALTYWGLSTVMVIGAAIIFGWAEAKGKGDFYDHRIFFVEAWMIVGVAIFWSLQTWDRWEKGAPPVTTSEETAKKAEVAARKQGVG